MGPSNQNQRNFGEPLDLADLLDFAEVDESDLESALVFWDENASDDFVGALD